MNAKLVIRALLWGLALTGLTMLVSYDYCLNGSARGFPFAAYCPLCEAVFAPLGGQGIHGGIHVVDLPRLLGDVALWGGIALGLQATLSRRSPDRPAWRPLAPTSGL